MSKLLDDLLLQRLYARETGLIAQAAALDQKANSLIVGVTFLSVQISLLLPKTHLWVLKMDLVISAILLTIAAALLASAAHVKTFRDEGAEELDEWFVDYAAVGATDEDALWHLRDAAKKRIQANSLILDKRAGCIDRSFWLLLTSLLSNILCATSLIFGWA